jgi:UDP-glucuronate 4-epimerase
LVTGAAGFIGYHLVKSLIQDKNEIVGLDNLNNYYNNSLKLDRVKILDKSNLFKFYHTDIKYINKIERIFKQFNPDFVVNLAAQAGVRYSIENPKAYVDSNIVGFQNIISLCTKYNVKGLIYASSSSVYSGNDKTPFCEDDHLKTPLSLYGVTKKTNEMIASTYSNLHGLNTTGLRYFTVYGPWYRPDMAMFIFIKKIINNEIISVYNNGNMYRDFTFIDDIVNGTKSAINKNYKHEIFNLGNNKSIKLLDMIKIIEINLNKKAKISFEPIKDGDPLKTHANINKSKRLLDYNPKISIEEGLPKLIKWYEKYYV